MNKTTLALLTAFISVAGATGASAQNRWHGHDWDPPAGQQWHHDNDRHDNDNFRRPAPHRRMIYAPRRGAVVRDYVYYPQARAYYAPWNHRWYSRRGTRWVVQESAPINISLGNGINISLGADSPVTYDSYVVKNYRSFY